MQDFTGVPCIVYLATMREAMADLGGDDDNEQINPLAPAELVIDHSVIQLLAVSELHAQRLNSVIATLPTDTGLLAPPDISFTQ